LLAPVLSLPRYQGQPWYFVDIVARDEGAGLGSGRWAYNEVESFSGWLAVRHGLRLQHLDPDQLEWLRTGSHANSITAVGSGRADFAGIDSMILDLAALDSELTVIDSWGPWPTPPVMMSRGLDPVLGDDLAAALLGIDGDIRWLPLRPDHLDPISAVAAAATISQ
jgi:ABC-type phosphate/phosphonate transport system substrate-binding protein